MPERPAASEAVITEKLDHFSQAALKKIARTLGLKPPDDQRSAYLGAVAALVGTPAHLELLERKLSDQQWALLNLLPLRFGAFRLRVLLLAGIQRGESEAAASADVQALLSTGCLLPRHGGQGMNRVGIDKSFFNGWGRNLIFEVVPAVADAARRRQPAVLPLPSVSPPSAVVSADVLELQRAIFIILAEAARVPIRLTKDGVPYKAQMKNLAAALARSAGSGGKRRASAESIPPLLYFALAVLTSAELLTAEDSVLRPSPASNRFFDAPAERQAQTLLGGWYNSWFKEYLLIPTLQFGPAWGPVDDTPWFKTEEDPFSSPRRAGVQAARTCVTAAIAAGVADAPDAWHPIEKLAGAVYEQYPEMLFPRLDDQSIYGLARPLRPGQRRAYEGVQRRNSSSAARVKDRAALTLYQDSDWMEVEGAFIRRTLAASLRWLGLVDVGPDTANPDRFHVTPLGQHLFLGTPLPAPERTPAGRTAVVQPNYEVVVLDGTANLALLSQLDAFCERRTLDRAATYQLTQPALVRGLDRGWSGRRVIEVLEAANDGPLPQNVRYSLEEWITRYESLTLREAASLLESDTESQLDAWLADPALRELLGERLGPTMVLVPSQRTEGVIERVAALSGRPSLIDYTALPAGVLQFREPDLVDLTAEGAEPYLRYRLAQFSTPIAETADRATFQITRESVQRAVELGWSEPKIREFLTEAAGVELSEDLRVRLLGWSGTLAPVQGEPLVALVLPAAPAGWSSLRQIPVIGELIRAVPVPDLALVAANDLPALREALAERGLGLTMATLTEAQLGKPAQTSSVGDPLRVLWNLGEFDDGPDDTELDEDLDDELAVAASLTDELGFLQRLLSGLGTPRPRTRRR